MPRLAIDTTQLAAAGDSQAVHLRYDLKRGLPLPDGSGRYYALETVEIQECAAETHELSATSCITGRRTWRARVLW